MKVTKVPDQHLKKVQEKLQGIVTLKSNVFKKSKKKITPLIAPSRFSECYSWPSKIAYALQFIKKGTPEEVASEIVELEGTASQEGVAELTVTVSEFLEKLRKVGKIKARSKPKKARVYSLI